LRSVFAPFFLAALSGNWFSLESLYRLLHADLRVFRLRVMDAASPLLFFHPLPCSVRFAPLLLPLCGRFFVFEGLGLAGLF
jgi:hypothetical protein